MSIDQILPEHGRNRIVVMVVYLHAPATAQGAYLFAGNSPLRVLWSCIRVFQGTAVDGPGKARSVGRASD